jgi:hypothetical protein
MASEVDIVNRALITIGAQSTVSSIRPSDGSPEASVAAILFDPTRDSLLRAATWNFARKQTFLAQLKSASDTNPTIPQPWQYEYGYPSDCIKCRYILNAVAQSQTSSVPLMSAVGNVGVSVDYGHPVKFEIATDTDASGNPTRVILTNQYQAQLVYTARITNPDIWDAEFQEAMVMSLSAKLVPALSLDMALYKACMQAAQMIIDQARIDDGTELVSNADHTPDWMSARGSSGNITYSGI